MKFFELKCPYCNAVLDYEDGLDTFYCKYCGGKVILEGQDKDVLRAKIREADSRRITREKDEALAREFRRKEKEFEHQKKIEKYRNRIWQGSFRSWVIWFIVVVVLFSGLSLWDSISERKLTDIYNEIQQFIDNGKYDEAYKLLPKLRGSDEWNERHEQLDLAIKQALINKMDNKYVVIGKAAASFEDTNYEDVVTYFKNLGFIYIYTFNTTSSKHWFPTDGEVEEVTIDGINDFTSNAEFPLDARVSITYYKRDK